MKNSVGGLQCMIFISHAWDEGIFEFGKNVIARWPEGCGGAYICFLSNPQNGGFIREMIESPTDSPFYKVLACEPQPQMVLMVPNVNTPIHSRLWCVYEAFLAIRFDIPVQVAGQERDLVTNMRAEQIAARIRKRRTCAALVGVTCFVLPFFFLALGFTNMMIMETLADDSAEDAPSSNDQGNATLNNTTAATSVNLETLPSVLATAILCFCPFLCPLCCCCCWLRRHLRKQQEEAQRQLIDVKEAKCTSPVDKISILREIEGQEQAINSMLASLIRSYSKGL